MLKCPKKYTIFSQGDKANAVFYVRAGEVKLTVLSDQGKEAVVAMLEAGDFLGEQCLTGQLVRTATATAVAEATILRIAQQTMVRTLREELGFSELLLKYVLSHSLRVEEDFVDQLSNSSEKRLARVLLLLANFGKKGKPQSAPCPRKSGNARRHDWHDAASGQFLCEQIQKVGLRGYDGTLRANSSLLNVVLHD